MVVLKSVTNGKRDWRSLKRKDKQLLQRRSRKERSIFHIPLLSNRIKMKYPVACVEEKRHQGKFMVILRARNFHESRLDVKIIVGN